MADTKITGLAADTSPTSDDLTVTVNDPAGTPANKKVTLGNLITKAHGLSDTTVIGVASGVIAAATTTGTGKVVLDTAPQISTIELGNASDTTIARASAGVISVEGVTIPSTSSTNTFTNKRITKRVTTVSDATSVTPNSDNEDITYQSNTQATGTLTINADGGTPTNGQSWVFKIKSTNVQTFSWNTIFIGGTTALPTASTGSSKIDYYTFIYDTVTPKWHFTGQAGGF